MDAATGARVRIPPPYLAITWVRSCDRGLLRSWTSATAVAVADVQGRGPRSRGSEPRPSSRSAVRRQADQAPDAPAAPAATAPVAATPAAARPTLRDVAMLAGVSAKTVSRVINAEPGVSPSKVDAVQRAIAQLNYRPNFTASSLRRSNGRTATIAAVLEDLANPFSSALHRALEDVARGREVIIVAGSVDEDPDRERALVRAFTMRQADGLVIVPASDNQAYLTREVHGATPVVFVDRPPVGLQADAVLVDNQAGAAE